MLYIGKSKIGKVRPKPNITYPLLRLPQHCSDFIGETEHIFETEQEGNKAFLIVFEDGEKAKSKVIQPSYITNIESRLSALESKIDKLIERNFKNIGLISEQSTKEVENKAPESGFEPESEPRQGSMIGHYTTRAVQVRHRGY